jgi:hypothetical protein
MICRAFMVDVVSVSAVERIVNGRLTGGDGGALLGRGPVAPHCHPMQRRRRCCRMARRRRGLCSVTTMTRSRKIGASSGQSSAGVAPKMPAAGASRCAADAEAGREAGGGAAAPRGLDCSSLQLAPRGLQECQGRAGSFS